MQFDLKRPCSNCPFRKGKGECFKLGTKRVEEIFEHSPSFQCHKTLDFDYPAGSREHHGDKPQQCAGVLSLLSRADKPSAIMQIGERLGYFDPSKLIHDDVYESLEAAIEAHS